jgi:hypothetical protein
LIFILILIDQDRWGDMVFETNEEPIVWDGQSCHWQRVNASRGLNPGVSVSLIILEKQDRASDLFPGDITLVR